MRGLGFIDAELNDRDVGVWVDVPQNGPRAVVEAPTVIATHRHRRKQFFDTRSKVEIAGRGILHVIQLARKAAEVVDRPWRGAHGDRCVFDEPVC